jgi:hypothetical protein
MYKVSAFVSVFILSKKQTGEQRERMCVCDLRMEEQG